MPSPDDAGDADAEAAEGAGADVAGEGAARPAWAALHEEVMREAGGGVAGAGPGVAARPCPVCSPAACISAARGRACLWARGVQSGNPPRAQARRRRAAASQRGDAASRR